jgi:hypothetical protein
MNIPMNYIGLGFNCLLLLLCLGGHFYIRSKTGKKLAFLPLFASAWFVSGISYILLITGTASGEWSITLLRTVLYLLFTAATLTAITELTKSRKKNK